MLKSFSIGLPQLGQKFVVSENRRLQYKQYFAIDALLIFPLLASCLGSLPLTKRIEGTSHCSITATGCTVTTTSHLLLAVSGSIPDLPSPFVRSMLYLEEVKEH